MWLWIKFQIRRGIFPQLGNWIQDSLETFFAAFYFPTTLENPQVFIRHNNCFLFGIEWGMGWEGKVGTLYYFFYFMGMFINDGKIWKVMTKLRFKFHKFSETFSYFPRILLKFPYLFFKFSVHFLMLLEKFTSVHALK